MDKVIRLFYSNRYSVLILSQIIFLFVYKFSLENYLLKLILSFDEEINVHYYRSKFEYLPISIILSIFILTPLILLRRKILTKILDLNEKLLITLFMLFLFLVQVLILFFIKTQPYSDSKKYLELAESLFTTGSYLNEFGNKTAFYPVGLPAEKNGICKK